MLCWRAVGKQLKNIVAMHLVSKSSRSSRSSRTGLVGAVAVAVIVREVAVVIQFVWQALPLPLALALALARLYLFLPVQSTGSSLHASSRPYGRPGLYLLLPVQSTHF